MADVTDDLWNWQAFSQGLWYTFDVTELLKSQGWDDKNSSLIHSAWQIKLVSDFQVALHQPYFSRRLTNCHLTVSSRLNLDLNLQLSQKRCTSKK